MREFPGEQGSKPQGLVPSANQNNQPNGGFIMKTTKLAACSLLRARASATGGVAAIALLLSGLLLPQGATADSCMTGESLRNGSIIINFKTVRGRGGTEGIHEPGTFCLQADREKKEGKGGFGYGYYAKPKKVGEDCPRSLGKYYEFMHIPERSAKRFDELYICKNYRVIPED